MKLPAPHPAARQVVEVLEAAGYRAYFVGGCVRDRLLGRKVADYDVATSARPETVQALFPHTVPTGLKHGTVTVLNGPLQVEVTTFRVEGRYTDHRRPERVKFVDDLYADLARRDFTINALAEDVNGRLLDPFGGVADLQAKRLRAVGDPQRRFAEDALRLLRAVRFAVQYDLRIEEKTAAALREKASLLCHVAVERRRNEWDKMLLFDVARSVCLLRESGLYPHVFLGVERYVEKADPTHLSCLGRLPQELPLRYAALGYFLSMDEKEMHQWLKLLRQANRLLRETLAVLRALLLAEGKGNRCGSWDEAKWRRYFYQVGREAAWAAQQVFSHCLAGRGVDYGLLFQSHMAEQPLWSLRELAVDGDVLLRAFPALRQERKRLGELLQYLADLVLIFPEKNNPSSLLKAAQGFLQERGMPI